MGSLRRTLGAINDHAQPFQQQRSEGRAHCADEEMKGYTLPFSSTRHFLRVEEALDGREGLSNLDVADTSRERVEGVRKRNGRSGKVETRARSWLRDSLIDTWGACHNIFPCLGEVATILLFTTSPFPLLDGDFRCHETHM